MIKILYVILVLCTAALLAVGIGIFLRVKRHWKQEHPEGQAASKSNGTTRESAEKEELP